MELSEDWRLKFATSDDFKAAIIASSRIVAGTCVGFCREAAASEAEYDLCIVDEASKATTTELLLPLSRCRRAVLVGDHHQLPPFVALIRIKSAVEIAIVKRLTNEFPDTAAHSVLQFQPALLTGSQITL